MSKFRLAVKRLFIGVALSILVLGFPLSAAADDTTGIQKPTGAAAGTYSYNSQTGLWENQYYTWDPATKLTTPKYSQTYTYNDTTGQYDTTTWVFNAAANEYQPVTISVTQPPAGAVVVGGPPAPAATTPVQTDSLATTSTNGTGIDSSNDINAGSGSLGTYDTSGTVTVNNNLLQTASSGDALVFHNTTGGSATSGSAVDMATILNILQSTTSLQGGGVTTFTKDIGNYTGDIVLDPSNFSSLNTVAGNNSPTNLTINSQNSGQINNDVNLTAGSGNATVMDNTTAGNATTGDAAAIANIVNVINSIVSAGQSFVGTININGSLNGDILLPQGTLDTLLASSSPSSTDSAKSTLNANLTDNSSIDNALNLAAKSGSATVSGNTTAGDATSGDASTNITLLNLTGRQVVGNDALLVFINIMGKWVGMIVNAPAGTSSAALCNCSSTNTGGATNTNLTSTNNSSINNNVNLRATSGNALVDHNTTAGSATSGDATASLNLLNISSSSLSLSNWLGVLFINVFGSWNGSFGIDTLAGNAPATSGGGAAPSVSSPTLVRTVKVFTVSSSGTGSDQNYSITPIASADNPTTGGINKHPAVLAAATNTPSSSTPEHHTSLLWTAGSLFVLAGIISAEETVTRRKEARDNLRRYIHGITVQPFKRY